MLKKFIQVFIFAGFWLCFVPWLVILLNQHNVLRPYGVMDYFIQYTTLLFVLIVVYWLINRIVDHCYIKQEVKRRVRKITIQRQLERLERGEIDLRDAQDLKTFTKVQKPKSPRSKRAASGKRPKPKEMQNLGANKAKAPKRPEDIAENSEDVVLKPTATSIEPVSTEMPSDLPPYTDEMKLLDSKA